MTAYSCPFCGQDVTEENVLFVDASFDRSFEDLRRYDFLMSCSRSYPLPDMKNFRGLYYHAIPDKVMHRDPNGFPTVLSIRAGDGLTPRELLREGQAEEAANPGTEAREAKPEPGAGIRRLATRACPHCHCSLQDRFGIAPTINVTLLGGRAAGKTVFLIALLQQLQNQLAQNGLGTVQILPESLAFMQPQIDYYVEHGGISMPTPTEDRLFPLVFEYYFQDRSYSIAIYDIAGEGIVNEQNQPNANYLVNHAGVEKAHVVWLVLDPNQLNSGAYGSASAGENASNGHDRFTMPISMFLARAIKATSHLGILKQVEHVITVMTKMDLPLTLEPGLFQGEALIKEDIGQTHKNAVDLRTLRCVDREVNRFISYKLGISDAKEMIQSAFRNNGAQPQVHLLAVSAYTRQQHADGIQFSNIFHALSPKHRIIEPFLKLLVLSQAAPVSQDSPDSAGNGRKPRPCPPKRRWGGK